MNSETLETYFVEPCLQPIGDMLFIDVKEVVAVQFVPGGNSFGARQTIEARVYLRGGSSLTVAEADGLTLLDWLSGKSAPSTNP